MSKARVFALVMVLCAAVVPALADETVAGIPSAPSWSPPTPEETAAALTGLPFDDFVDSACQYLFLHMPERITYYGLSDDFGVRNDRWADFSPEGIAAWLGTCEVILEMLDGFPESDLTEDQRLSAAALRSYATGRSALLPRFFYHYNGA